MNNSRRNFIRSASTLVAGATTAQMGNIAYRTGKKVYWDAAQGKFTDSDANKLLAAQYHNGYKLPNGTV